MSNPALKAAPAQPVQIPVPLALAFGIFDAVIGSCNGGAQALKNMSNPECAGILLSIAEELQSRAKTMLIESQRRVVVAAPGEAP